MEKRKNHAELSHAEKRNCVKVCVYLTSPGSLILALRYSGGPTGGPTSKVNSGLEKMRGEFRDKITVMNTFLIL